MLEVILGGKLLAGLLSGLAAVLATLAIFFGVHRHGQSTGRAKEQADNERVAREVEQDMAKAQADGPRDGGGAADRMRDGSF